MYNFTYNELLGSAKTSTTNPDPNTLSTKNPMTNTSQVGTDINGSNVASAWVTQSSTYCKALFPKRTKDGAGEIPIRVHFVPSSAGATFTVTVWIYNPKSNSWGKPYNNNTFNFTGDTMHTISTPGANPIFLQLSSISAGTISIYFDDSVAKAY